MAKTTTGAHEWFSSTVIHLVAILAIGILSTTDGLTNDSARQDDLTGQDREPTQVKSNKQLRDKQDSQNSSEDLTKAQARRVSSRCTTEQARGESRGRMQAGEQVITRASGDGTANSNVNRSKNDMPDLSTHTYSINTILPKAGEFNLSAPCLLKMAT